MHKCNDSILADFYDFMLNDFVFSKYLPHFYALMLLYVRVKVSISKNAGDFDKDFYSLHFAFILTMHEGPLYMAGMP